MIKILRSTYVAVKITNILLDVLVEKVAKKTIFPGVTATDHLKIETANVGWYQVFDGTVTLIVGTESDEATDRLQGWSKDDFFGGKNSQQSDYSSMTPFFRTVTSTNYTVWTLKATTKAGAPVRNLRNVRSSDKIKREKAAKTAKGETNNT